MSENTLEWITAINVEWIMLPGIQNSLLTWQIVTSNRSKWIIYLTVESVVYMIACFSMLVKWGNTGFRLCHTHDILDWIACVPCIICTFDNFSGSFHQTTRELILISCLLTVKFLQPYLPLFLVMIFRSSFQIIRRRSFKLYLLNRSKPTPAWLEW